MIIQIGRGKKKNNYFKLIFSKILLYFFVLSIRIPLIDISNALVAYFEYLDV